MKTLNGYELPIHIDEASFNQLCQKWKVKSLEVFGSILREDWDPDKSDVDLVVEFLPEARISSFDRLYLKWELEEMLSRSVDLLRRRAVEKDENLYRKQAILGVAEVLYVSN